MRERKISAFAAIVFLTAGVVSAGAPSPAPHLSEAEKLNRRAHELFKAARYSKAIPLAAQALNGQARPARPAASTIWRCFNNRVIRFTTTSAAKWSAMLDCG